MTNLVISIRTPKDQFPMPWSLASSLDEAAEMIATYKGNGRMQNADRIRMRSAIEQTSRNNLTNRLHGRAFESVATIGDVEFYVLPFISSIVR